MEKEKFLSKRVGIIIGSILFALCFIGITYAAYLTGQTYNEVNMASMVTPDITLTEDKTMMIQGILPTPRDIAIKAASTNGCYDKSEKPIPVCSLYQFTVQNTNQEELEEKVKFYLNITENTYANYYYMVFDGEKENISEDIAPIIDSTHLPNNDLGKKYLKSLTIELTPNQSKTYTILFYVNETGENQLYIDTNKVFNANIIPEAIVSGKYNHYEEELLKGSIPDIENSGLTPIVYDGENWVVAGPADEWYNYSEQKWANAVSLKDGVSNKQGKILKVPDGDTITEANSDVYAMFVWIPRFSYTIGCLNSDTTCYGYRLNDNPDTDPGDPTATLPGAIDIKFVSREDKLEIPDMDNGIYPTYKYTSNETRETEIKNWYTHPAFWWDENGDGVRPEDNSEELSGIWVGKFETTGSSTTPTVLPNVTSLKSQKVSYQFATAQKFSAENNIYGIDNTKTDSHMMKNSEWAAVAYLSQSIYGKYGNKDYSGANKEIYINNYSSYYTGISAGAPSTTSSSSITCKYNVIDDRGSGKGACGAGASTTGNIYGVYDMSGGAYEYVMGYYENATTSYPWGSTSSSNFAGFTATTKPENKYFNGYQNNTIFTKSKEVVGHATYETSAWYSDYNNNISASDPWVARGGYYYSGSNAGAFYSNNDNGDNDSLTSFRSALATIVR